jgi:hypothetical protein
MGQALLLYKATELFNVQYTNSEPELSGLIGLSGIGLMQILFPKAFET